MSAGRVLIVDDEPQLRRIMRATLTGAGYEVEDAPNGEQALERLREFRPDLVLLDINMPVMNGLDFIKKVKELGTYEHIPIIISSTEGKEEDTKRGIALGARGYVTKPVQPSELHSLFEALLPASR